MGNRKWWIVMVAGLVAFGTAGVAASGGTPRSILSHLVSTQRPAATTWMTRLQVVDDAIARHDVSRAVYEWREAYGAALGTRDWHAMAEIGDRAVAIDGLGGANMRFLSEARHSYLTALLQARSQKSIAGLERIAAAFEKLGDTDITEQAWRMVERIDEEQRVTATPFDEVASHLRWTAR